MSGVTRDHVYYFGSCIAAPGASAAIAAGVVKYGHTFTPFARLLQAGLLSAGQSFLALFLNVMLRKNKLITENPFINFAISHIAVGSGLYALTALAAKVGLIAATVTLPEAALLISTTYFVSFVVTFGTYQLAEAVEQ